MAASKHFALRVKAVSWSATLNSRCFRISPASLSALLRKDLVVDNAEEIIKRSAAGQGDEIVQCLDYQQFFFFRPSADREIRGHKAADLVAAIQENLRTPNQGVSFSDQDSRERIMRSHASSGVPSATNMSENPEDGLLLPSAAHRVAENVRQPHV
jgi:hypothetical protein